MGSRLWFALWRPGGKEPEACDFDKSDLWSLALRRTAHCTSKNQQGMEDKPLMYWMDDPMDMGGDYITRDAAIKRLRRKGWRLERLPERFWEKARKWEDLQEKEVAFDRDLRRSLGL